MKKTNLILGFMLIMLLAMSTNLMAQTSTPPSNYATSDGSSGDPYFITTLDNLYWLSQTSADWDMYFIQTANIDASATSGWNSNGSGGYYGFSPIGNSGSNFTGEYNGADYTIDALYINRTSTNYIGLFGLTNGANIINIGVTNVNITGAQGVGGLVGRNQAGSSTVSNSYSTGSVSGGDSVGGLVGDNLNTAATLAVSNSYSTVSVTGGANVGGLVGYIQGSSSTVSNSYSTGSVTGSAVPVGGLVGRNYYSEVVNSYSTGV